jgi:hypothetical protein
MNGAIPPATIEVNKAGRRRTKRWRRERREKRRRVEGGMSSDWWAVDGDTRLLSS